MEPKNTLHPVREITPLEKNLLGIKIEDAHTLLPGLLLAITLAWLSFVLSDYIGETLMGFDNSPLSPVMLVIPLGMILGNILPSTQRLKPGLQFSMKKLLRLGIILLGIRLSVADVFQLGAMGIPIVVLCITSALLFTTWLNQRLNLPHRLGTLIAVGSSICGVTAIVATAPAIDAEDREVAYAVAIITVFGLLAMFIYPYLSYVIFAGDPVQAGLFLGTAIHDTSQVTGAGLFFADLYGLPRALDVATVTKLVRNSFMVMIIPLMTLYYTRKSSQQDGAVEKKVNILKLFPLFIVGFILFAVLRSTGDAAINAGNNAFGLWDAAAWKAIHSFFKSWAVNFMVVALAGVGVSTSFKMFKGMGIKPFLVGLGAATVVGLISFGGITIMQLLSTF